MTKQEFIDKYHLASPKEQGRLIHELFQGILEAVGNPGKITATIPGFRWNKESDCWVFRDAAGFCIGTLDEDYPGDIEEAKAALLRIAEAGR